MKYRAKSVENGEYVIGSLVVFDDEIKNAEPYDKDDYYKGMTNTFIVECSKIKINFCFRGVYVMDNMFTPVIPDSVEEIKQPNHGSK